MLSSEGQGTDGTLIWNSIANHGLRIVHEFFLTFLVKPVTVEEYTSISAFLKRSAYLKQSAQRQCAPKRLIGGMGTFFSKKAARKCMPEILQHTVSTPNCLLRVTEI